MSRAIGGHQSAAMISDTWLTPPHIIKALGQFDLDPCAAPDPKPWPTAQQHYTLPTDGLREPWHGRVWLNPPYSREAVKWLRKLAEHGQGTALVFARTETSWFVETVWAKASAVLFLHGRIHFHYADGTRAKANSGAPSCLVAYGDIDAMALSRCGVDGTFVALRGGDGVDARQGESVTPCVCSHNPDEHHDMWGCVGTGKGGRPCLCATYEADEVPF